MPFCSYCQQEERRACAPNNTTERCGIFEGGVLFYRRYSVASQTWEDRSSYFDSVADFNRALERWTRQYEGSYVFVANEVANRFGAEHHLLAQGKLPLAQPPIRA